MDNFLSGFDEQGLKDFIAKFCKREEIKKAQFARKMGRENLSPNRQSQWGGAFFTKKHKITLEELFRVAGMMHRPITDLIRIAAPIQMSHGAGSINLSQGDDSVAHAHTTGEAVLSTLQALGGMSEEERKLFFATLGTKD